MVPLHCHYQINKLVTAEFEEVIEGNTHRFQRPEAWLTMDLDEGTHEGRCLHMDWTSSTAQDPRWINEGHIDGKHAVVAERIFVRLHAQDTCLTPLASMHPASSDACRLNMPTDGMDNFCLLESGNPF